MGCSSISLANIGKECRNAKGGVKEIWIVESSKINNVTVNSQTQVITSIGFRVFSGEQFYHWEFNAETASLTSTLNINGQNGTRYVQSDLILKFSKMESVKRLQIVNATEGEFVVIVKDMNGKYFYLGYDNPVFVSAGSGETGTAMGDANCYNLTLTDLSHSLPMEVILTEENMVRIGLQESLSWGPGYLPGG